MLKAHWPNYQYLCFYLKRRVLLTPVNQPLHPVLEVPQLAVADPEVSRELELLKPHQRLEGNSIQGREPVSS